MACYILEVLGHDNADEDGNTTEGSSSSLSTLSLFCSQEASRLEVEHEASLTKHAKEENLALQKLIKEITEVSTFLSSHPYRLDFEVLDKGKRKARGVESHVLYCSWLFNFYAIFLM